MTITESNRLIAEFCGIYTKKGFWGWNLYNSSGGQISHFATWTEPMAWFQLESNEKMFHNSWQWLMPVLDRLPFVELKTLIFENGDKQVSCYIGSFGEVTDRKTLLKLTYDTLIKYIEYQNTKHK